MKRNLLLIFLTLQSVMALTTLTSCGDDDIGNSNGDNNNNQGKVNHERVDLGLPSGTQWATCNIGAYTPEEYGDYFSWGETQPKNNYSWSTYKYCKGSSKSLTKYCTDSEYGTIDYKTELELADDAATVNYGIGWRTPSLEQFQELYNSNYTTTEWTTTNGRNGYKITSKKNGKSIFLPSAGFYDGTTLYGVSNYGHYGSRLLSTYESSYMCYLGFSSGSIGLGNVNRNVGLSIRPVWKQ